MKRFFAFVSVSVLLLILSCQSNADLISAQEQQIMDLQYELEMKNRELAELQSSADADEQTLAALNAEIGDLTAELADLTSSYQDLQRELADQAAMESRLKSQELLIIDLQTAIRDRNEALAAMEAMTQADENALAALRGEINFLNSELARLSGAYDDLKGELKDEQEKTERAVRDLRNLLAEEIARGDVEIFSYGGLIIIHIKNRILFNPDRAEIRPENEEILLGIARIFDAFPDRMIRVEGHTATGRDWSYPTSWELGAARAVNIARFFQERAGVSPERLVAVSFGEYRPLTSNATEAGKIQNRRVEIILINKPLYQWQELLQADQ